MLSSWPDPGGKITTQLVVGGPQFDFDFYFYFDFDIDIDIDIDNCINICIDTNINIDIDINNNNNNINADASTMNSVHAYFLSRKVKKKYFKVFCFIGLSK